MLMEETAPPPKPILTRQRRLSEDEGEQLLTKNLLVCRNIALQQYAKHPIINRMRVMRYMRYDTYSGLMDYLGEIQVVANRCTDGVFSINWKQVPPHIAFPLSAIIRKYITSDIECICINVYNFNVSFTAFIGIIDPVFKSEHIFPHINALSLHALGWEVV